MIRFLHTIEFLLLIATVSMVATACKQESSDPDGETLWASRFLEDHLTAEVCLYCKTPPDVLAFEDSLGSTRVDMEPLQMARAFMGYPIDEPDRGTGKFHGDIPLAPYYDSVFYDYFVFLRPRKSDSLPFFAHLYQIDKEKDDEGDFHSMRHIGKFFFDDPVMNPYTGYDPVTSFAPDTNYIWTLYDIVGKKLGEQYDPRKAAMGPSKVNTFFYRKEFLGSWKYWYRRFDRYGRDRDYIEAAPYREHYLSNGWGSKIGEYELEHPDLISTIWMLGWSSSDEHYLRIDSVNGGRRYWYDIKGKDLAVYVAVLYR